VQHHQGGKEGRPGEREACLGIQVEEDPFQEVVGRAVPQGEPLRPMVVAGDRQVQEGKVDVQILEARQNQAVQTRVRWV